MELGRGMHTLDALQREEKMKQGEEGRKWTDEGNLRVLEKQK